MKLLHRVLKMALIGAITALASNVASARSTLEGVWQISKPVVRLLPADGSDVPLTQEGLKALNHNVSLQKAGDTSFDPAAGNCGSPGQPKLMLTNDKFRIFVRESMVTVVYEQNRLFRQISLDNTLENPVIGEYWWKFGTMQGRSTGSLSGDTLHIETKGLTGGKLIDSVMPHSDQLVISEKWFIKDDSTLVNELTLNDPLMFTRPWTARIEYERRDESAYPFDEKVCLDTL